MTRKAEKVLKINATKLFFKYLEKASNDDYKPFPITFSETDVDEDYGSFNSFKINELPDYLFGIWWNLETHIETKYVYGERGLEDRTLVTEKVDYLIGEFFGDYEREVDKFKPWRCYFNVTLRIPIKQLNKLIAGEIDYLPVDDTIATLCSLRDIIDKFIYIKNEPELAFCQCWCGLNYNEQYVTRAYARREYKKYIQYKIQKQDEENDALKLQFEYLKNLLDKYGFEQFEDYLVIDQNYDKEYLYTPRFEIMFKMQKAWEDAVGCEPNQYGFYGMYSLSDILTDNDRESRKLRKERDKFEKSAKKKYKYVYWFDEVSSFGIITSPKRFAKEMKKDSIVDISSPEKYFSNEVFR